MSEPRPLFMDEVGVVGQGLCFGRVTRVPWNQNKSVTGQGFFDLMGRQIPTKQGHGEFATCGNEEGFMR